MTITLDTIDISGLVRVEDFSGPVRAQANHSVNGGVVVWEGAGFSGSFDLIGGLDWGWLTHADMVALKALASVVGGSYTLNYEGVSSTVRFRTEDIPVISGQPLIPRSNIENEDYYSEITIKLMEV